MTSLFHDERNRVQCFAPCGVDAHGLVELGRSLVAQSVPASVSRSTYGRTDLSESETAHSNDHRQLSDHLLF